MAARGSSQEDLFGAPPAPAETPPDLPEGFAYRPALISAAEEAELVAALEPLSFAPFDFQGFKANRHVVSFGWRYDYGVRKLMSADPIPAFLDPLRRRVGEAFGRPAAAFQQVLINRYAPGAGIGWHRDRPHFEEVAGVSLLAPRPFRFRRKVGEGWARRTLTVEPRSAYLLSGPARTEWEHSIPPLDSLRYSITFRTLRR